MSFLLELFDTWFEVRFILALSLLNIFLEVPCSYLLLDFRLISEFNVFIILFHLLFLLVSLRIYFYNFFKYILIIKL